MRYTLLIMMVIVIGGCSHQVALQQSNLERGQVVSLTTTTGEHIHGKIGKVNPDYLIIVDKDGQAWRAPRKSIKSVTGAKTVYDNSGQLITERDIAARKTNKNKWIFMLSGGGLSLGTSFFLSSMISRASSDDNRDAIIYGGTAAGTLLGGYLFAKIGAKKDRQQAIDEIIEERKDTYQDKILLEKQRKRELEEEIERLQKRLDDESK